jgi:LysR family glycine cleavage system transcriptional activator
MSRVLPPLNALRAFEAAGRHQRFSRAAEELRVSHSAISRHVRGLEDRLSTQLFRDVGPGVTLTPEGRAYLERVTPALDAISEATESVGEAPSGQVLINSDPIFAYQVLAPQLGPFADAHSDIELRLVGSSALADVDRYEADMAVRFVHAGHLDRPNDLISDAPLFPYARPGLLPPNPSLQQILTPRRLRDRLDQTIWARWADAAGWSGPAIEEPNWRLRAPVALEATLGGYGVYLSSAEVLNVQCKRGTLVRLSEVGIQDGAYRLLVQEGALRRKSVRIVRDWLLDLSRPFREGRFWVDDQPIG